MERAKLIVKNFGPLKDIRIEVREMVTFIGAQASGKSTLAKLLSIFEDESFRQDDTISFEEELKKYNILSYLNKNTFIEYTNNNSSYNKNNTTPFQLNYSAGKFEKRIDLNIVKKYKTYKNDLSDSNSEIKNSFKELLIGSLIYCNTFDPHFIQKTLQLFTNDIQKNKFKKLFFKGTKESITEKHVDEILEILEKEKTTNNYLDLFENIVITFPNIFLYDSIYIPTERNILQIIHTNIIGLINNNIQIPKYLLNSGQEYEKAINTIKELSLTIIDKKIKYSREGQNSYIYHNKNEKVNLLESASGLQSIIPILLLVEYSKSLKEKYNFNFVVEEPELNLYPKAQHELIKYLVKNCLFDRKNLILTTHSPFVLASINNLLLAHNKGQTHPKEVNKIINKKSWLNPKNFIAYELKNGKAKKIMNDKLGQISENMIDSVSDSFADEFDKLLDL